MLRQAGNGAVLPGVDHYFKSVVDDPVWNRVSLEGLRRPMAAEALDVMERWAVKVPAP